MFNAIALSDRRTACARGRRAAGDRAVRTSVEGHVERRLGRDERQAHPRRTRIELGRQDANRNDQSRTERRTAAESEARRRHLGRSSRRGRQGRVRQDGALRDRREARKHRGVSAGAERDVDRGGYERGLQGRTKLNYCFLPKIGCPKSSVSRCKYLLFSWQMYSVSSPFAFQGMSHRIVNGFVYAPASSTSAS